MARVRDEPEATDNDDIDMEDMEYGSSFHGINDDDVDSDSSSDHSAPALTAKSTAMANVRKAYEEATAASFASKLVNTAPIKPSHKKEHKRHRSVSEHPAPHNLEAAISETKKGLRRVSLPVSAPTASSATAAPSKVKKSKKRVRLDPTVEEEADEGNDDEYKVAVIVLLTQGVTETTEDTFVLNGTSRFPDKIDFETLERDGHGATVMDQKNGITLHKSWSANQVDRKLHSLFPSFFPRIDHIAKLPAEQGGGGALGWLLCSKRGRQAIVLPTLLPNGQKLFDHCTNPRRKWKESIIVLTTRACLADYTSKSTLASGSASLKSEGKQPQQISESSESSSATDSDFDSDGSVKMPSPSQIMKRKKIPRRCKSSISYAEFPSTPTPVASSSHMPVIDLTGLSPPKLGKRKRSSNGSDTEPDEPDEGITYSLSSFHFSDDGVEISRFNSNLSRDPYGSYSESLLSRI